MDIKRFFGNFARSYLAVGALSVSAYAGADNIGNWDCCPQACAPCAPHCDSCCGMPCNPAPACNWGYNPPAYLKCCGSNDCCATFWDTLGAEVDFLWWRASNDCLKFGSENTVLTRFPTVPTETVTDFDSHVKKPDFKFDPGFRLGLSHYCPCDCWDVSLEWTHFHTKASVDGFSDFTDFEEDYTFFRPYWEKVAGVFPDETSGRWTLELDTLDLEFGYKYYVSHCFVLRPTLGLRGARINQGFHVESEANRSGTNGRYESFASSENDFLAIGPRVGVDLKLDLGCGFALVGEAAGSILYGRFKRHSDEFFTAFPAPPSEEAPFSEDFHEGDSGNRVSRTVTDLALGVEWDHCFCWCNHYHPVSLSFVWEHHTYWGFNDFGFTSDQSFINNGSYSATDDFGDKCCCDGNIYIQGLTVALNIGF